LNTLFKSLRPYLWKYRWPLLLGTVFIIISNVFSIYPAQIVRDTINLVGDLVHMDALVDGFGAQQAMDKTINQSLILFGVLMVAAALLRGYFLFLVRQTIIVVSRKIEYDQKNVLFDKYQQYSLSILRRRQTGDLMARISEDIGSVRMFTGPGIMYTLNTLTLFVMVMVTMIYVNAELTFYVLLPMPILALSIFWVHSIINKRSEETQAQLSTISSFTQEAFSGIRLLRAFAREKVSERQFNRESDLFKLKSMKLARVDAFFYPTIFLLVGLSTVLAVWIGGEKVIAGTLTIGNIAEFVLYINLLTWPVASLGWITSMIQKAAASQKRLDEMMALNSEIEFAANSPAPADAAIEFDRVSFTYADTGIQALKNISFSVPAGKTLGIVGSTGCGKSTVANLLLRLFDAGRGTIHIGGHTIETYSKEALRGAIGYVPQDVFLFSDTIAANIAFGKQDATPEEIKAAAEFAGVLDDILAFPKGFETEIGERGVTLSGGQKQRVSIARAYLRKPPLLILDDALSAVDTRTEAKILHHLRAQIMGSAQAGDNGHAAYRPTLVIISHRISAVQDADTILVMDDGAITERGTHADLIAAGGDYAQLFQKQLLEEEIVGV
jgi:ATP-binding cassette subfamily B protein